MRSQGKPGRGGNAPAGREKLLQSIGATLARSLDAETVFQDLVKELAQALSVCRCLLTLLPEQPQGPGRASFEYRGKCCAGEEKKELEIARRNDPAVAAALQASPLFVVADVGNDPRLASLREQYLAAHIRSLVVMTIRDTERSIGILELSTCSPQPWADEEIDLIATVAEQIALVIRQAELLREAKEAATIESLLRHIAQIINQATTMDQVYLDVGRELGQYFKTESLTISRYDPATRGWQLECSYRKGERILPGNPNENPGRFAGLGTAGSGGLLMCSDVEKDPAVADLPDGGIIAAGIRAYLVLDLEYEGETRLSIEVSSPSGPRTWTPQEVNILRAAGDQMMIAYKRAELFEEVLRVKLEWETTFDALADGLLIFDENGILRRINQAGAAMEGKQMEDLLGRTCCSLLQGVESEGCKVMRVIESGEPVTFDILPERMARPVLITISPLEGGRESAPSRAARNGGGTSTAESAPRPRARGAVCIVRDLSELRAAEAAAREQKNYLVKLVEHARDAICALSPTGGLIWCNEHFVTMSGRARRDLMGVGYQRFLPDDDRAAIARSFLKALAGETQATEMHVMKGDDDEMFLMVTLIPIYDEGIVTGVLMISRDITEEKLASEREAQAEKMRMLGQIAAGVAHNFNNVLAAVLGHAQLIKRDAVEGRLIKQAEIIERAALDGAEMVKRIQSFGNQQNDAGYEPVDINQLIVDSVGLTRARWEGEAQARGIAYQVETAFNPAPIVYGSASEIREVFVNIILNSLDAMPTGGTLRILTSTTKDSVQINFTDHGDGMSEEVRKHIFEPFFTTKGPSGTGLGLAVSYSAIERHGGMIEVTSAVGRGTTFTITLPAEESTQIITRQKAHHYQAQKSSFRILIVDDDDRVRDALVEMVKILGYLVCGAESGIRALEMIERESFDLVLTDLSMPGMDGWTVVAEIRKRYPKMKIVILTGYGKPVEISNLNNDLAVEILSKPVRLDELSMKISQLLS